MNPIRHLYRRFSDSPRAQQWALKTAYEPRFRAWCAAAAPCDVWTDQFELYRSVLDREGLQGPIDYLEFGVFEGKSIRWWTENNRDPASTFVGFDCFEGLPEDWGVCRKGHFSVNGKAPQIADERCGFVKGLFQDTLAGWMRGRDFGRRIVLHLDADLYSSTLFVLSQFLPLLKPGDIVMFDEFNDPLHEFRALMDATTAFPRAFELLGRTNWWIQAAFKAA